MASLAINDMTKNLVLERFLEWAGRPDTQQYFFRLDWTEVIQRIISEGHGAFIANMLTGFPLFIQHQSDLDEYADRVSGAINGRRSDRTLVNNGFREFIRLEYPESYD